MSDKGFNFNVGTISGEQVNVGQNVNATQNNYGKDKQTFRGNEVLHIIGESAFGSVDSVSLKNAGVKTKIVQADVIPFYNILVDELARQRADNVVSKLWHISSHGSPDDGLLFGTQWVSWLEFQKLITPYDQLEVLFIAACSTVNVADAVIGPFKYVLACSVAIPDDAASKATGVFWNSIVNGKTPEESFEIVKINTPDFAPNLRLRGLR